MTSRWQPYWTQTIAKHKPHTRPHHIVHRESLLMEDFRAYDAQYNLLTTITSHPSSATDAPRPSGASLLDHYYRTTQRILDNLYFLIYLLPNINRPSDNSPILDDIHYILLGISQQLVDVRPQIATLSQPNVQHALEEHDHLIEAATSLQTALTYAMHPVPVETILAQTRPQPSGMAKQPTLQHSPQLPELDINLGIQNLLAFERAGQHSAPPHPTTLPRPPNWIILPSGGSGGHTVSTIIRRGTRGEMHVHMINVGRGISHRKRH